MKTKVLMVAALLCCSTLFFSQTGYAPSNVPTSGLVGWWPMDLTYNGNDSWNGYTGSVNGPVHVLDRFTMVNGAYTFNGAAPFDYIATTCPGVLGTGPRAISFWAKTSNAGTGIGMYTVCWGDNMQGRRFGVCLDYPGSNGGAVGGFNCDGNTGPGVFSTMADWHHYVFQFAGVSGLDQFEDVEVYFDGTFIGYTTHVSGLNRTTFVNTVNSGPGSNVYFGITNYSTPNAYTGELDDVGIWDRMLTDCEIMNLYQACSCCDASPRKPQEATHVIGANEAKKTSVKFSEGNRIVLNQNAPNPFAESTEITYHIPAGFIKAQLLFSDVNGTLIQTVDITEAGKGSLTVFADDLHHGVYSYHLLVDGKTVDTKKMIKE